MAESVKIIENGIVVTSDAQRRVGKYAILLKDERIAELNLRADGFKVRFPNAEVIDASEKVLFPGFVDPHYHGESFLLRNWTSGVLFSRWGRENSVRKAFARVYRDATKDDLAALYRAAYFSALKSGVTFLCEFGFDNLDHPFSAAREAMKRADLRGCVGVHNGEQIELAREQTSGAIQYGMVLPDEDNLTTYNLQSTLRVVGELKWPIISHLGETRRGLESLKRNFQRSIVRILDEYQVFQRTVHLLHLACLEEGDDDLLAERRLPLIINPTSLLSKRADLPPFATFLARGIPLALCSDWGCSDPFENIKSFMHLVAAIGADPLDPFQLIEMHTIDAARALHVEQEVGSIEPGKKADFAFIDISDLRIHQVILENNPALMLRTLLDQVSARNVSDVMINGEFFVRKGQIMTYAEEDLKREYREMFDRLMKPVEPPAQDPAAPPSENAAPILHLVSGSAGEPREEPAEEPDFDAGDGEDEPFEEGFRIIGKTGSISERSAPPPRPTPPPKPERREDSGEPKPSGRVFGEDDF